MYKKMLCLLGLLFSFGFPETLQYCTNSPAGYLGSANEHYGQVMTPSVNKGMIQWVSVYTSRSYMGTVTGRMHRIELWRFDGTQPYGKFYDVEVFVPIGFVGWWNTYTNQYWDGGEEQNFTAVMQTEYTYGNPYNWSQSQIGYDGIQTYTEIIRNWEAGSNEQWFVFPGNYGNLMFKVGFLPGGQEVFPTSLGMIRTCFR
jgi:hypothetical protein